MRTGGGDAPGECSRAPVGEEEDESCRVGGVLAKAAQAIDGG
jgi:hypothetical protein